MSTVVLPETSRRARVAPVPRMLWKQTRAQARLLLRQPAISVVAVSLPVLLYVLFGLPNAHRAYSASVSMGAYFLVSLGAYGVGLVMVFSFGVTVAIDRGQKNDLLMRATPLPPAVDLAARTVLAVVFAAVTLAVLFGVAMAGGVRLPATTWLSIMGELLLGSLPVLAFGFAIAYLTGPNAAAAIINLAYMILAFASGLLVPLNQLPAFVQRAALLLPTYHYAQLSWSAAGVQAEAPLASIAWLVGYAALFFGIALWAYRRDASRRFG